jgi:hypothetical protein
VALSGSSTRRSSLVIPTLLANAKRVGIFVTVECEPTPSYEMFCKKASGKLKIKVREWFQT